MQASLWSRPKTVELLAPSQAMKKACVNEISPETSKYTQSITATAPTILINQSKTLSDAIRKTTAMLKFEISFCTSKFKYSHPYVFLNALP